MTQTTSSTPQTGYAPVGDLSMYYEIHGAGGTPLLLLHGGLFDIEQQFGQELGVAPVRHELLARLQKANKTALKRCVADYATVWRRRAQQPLPLQV